MFKTQSYLDTVCRSKDMSEEDLALNSEEEDYRSLQELQRLKDNAESEGDRDDLEKKILKLKIKILTRDFSYEKRIFDDSLSHPQRNEPGASVYSAKMVVIRK